MKKVKAGKSVRDREIKRQLGVKCSQINNRESKKTKIEDTESKERKLLEREQTLHRLCSAYCDPWMLLVSMYVSVSERLCLFVCMCG